MATIAVSFLLGAVTVKYGFRVLRKWLSTLLHSASGKHGLQEPARPDNRATLMLGAMREMGELVTVKMRVQNVAANPSKRTWLGFESQSLLVICEFDVEHRVDLRRLKMRQTDAGMQILVPAGKVETSMKDFKIFHMQGNRFLGLPVNGLDKNNLNRLIREARDEAMRPFVTGAGDLMTEGEESLRKTLSAVCYGLGVDVDDLEFRFLESPSTPKLSQTASAERLLDRQPDNGPQLLA